LEIRKGLGLSETWNMIKILGEKTIKKLEEKTIKKLEEKTIKKLEEKTIKKLEEKTIKKLEEINYLLRFENTIMNLRRILLRYIMIIELRYMKR